MCVLDGFLSFPFLKVFVCVCICGCGGLGGGVVGLLSAGGRVAREVRILWFILKENRFSSVGSGWSLAPPVGGRFKEKRKIKLKLK